MKKVLLGGVFLAFLSVSCTKNPPAPTPPEENINAKYMTFTPGSSCSYTTYDSLAATSTDYTITSTSLDSTINNRTYHVFNNVDTGGTKLNFYNYTGNEYFQFASLSAQIPPVELKYLIDNQPVGYSWESPLNITQTQSGVTLNFTATLKYTIEEKGTSTNAHGTDYSDVTKIRTEIINPSVTSSLPIPVVVEPITQDIYAYFAPKYGMIKREFLLILDVSTFGQVQNLINTNTFTELTSSNIP